MKGRKRHILRCFSIAMAVLLLFSYSWTNYGGNVKASESKSNETVIRTTKVKPKNKINQDLENSFKKHDQVTFLLKFKDQVNTKKVAQKALSEKQKKTMTTAKANLIKRSAIVSSLRNKAHDTQYSVKNYLKTQEKAGNVQHYRSYFIVNMMAVTGTEKVAEQLSKMAKVEKVLPNRKRHLIQQPKKVKKAVKAATKKAQKKAKTSGDNDNEIEPNIKHIGAPQAWSQGIDGSGTVVANIDTGVQWDHPALKEKYRGYNPEDPDHPNNEMNWYDPVNDTESPTDVDGHGTHTMGTMVGSEPDGSNQVGVAPGAKWIAANAFGSDGTATDVDLLAAGQWMLAPTDKSGNTHPEMAPDVINNSWGGGPGIDEFYRDMVKNWRAAGIFPAFAAGNTTFTNPGGPGSVASPGNYPEAFTVGATDNDDNLAGFSLRGPSPYDEIKPDIVAPGVDIRSSVPGSEYDGTYSGTSMATPAVAGTIALLRQANSSISVDGLENILTTTANPLTDEDFPQSPNNGYGHGGLRVDNAVASVISGLGEIKGHVTKEGKGSEAVSATVTVKGSGISTKTDPTDGSYILNLPIGQYTLEFEAYGFDSVTKTLEVKKDETITVDISMQEITKGILEGTITDQQTGDPVEGATISLIEDAAVKPVQTGEDGHYSLKVYEGDYTMHVASPNYFGKDINLTIKGNNSTNQNVKLKPFVSPHGDEIKYDDGSAEAFGQMIEAGGGWGVRMSLPEGHDSAMVTGGRFLFKINDSGDDQFQVEIWDASGKNGAPGKKLAGPIDATAAHDGEWTTVDLKDQGVKVDGDFYMVVIQPKSISEDPPSLGGDLNDPYSYRDWHYVNGSWSQDTHSRWATKSMIRALVEYEIPIPEILSPKNNSYTNDSTINVQGKSAPNVDINLLENGKKVDETSTDDDGHFSKDIKLSKGENRLTATATSERGTTDPSKPVTVTLDQDKPNLTISSPENRMKSNKMVVKVNGTVKDTNLSWVKINGRKANVNDDGNYSKRIILDNGKNKIKVVARDKANNRTRKTRTVFAKFDAPTISSLEPNEDKHLKTGQSMIISFDSEPGLDASFTINAPLANPTTVKIGIVNKFSMMETTPGHYIGVWTATNMSDIKGAKVEVTVKDDYGNVSTKEADGELFINVPESE